MGGERKRGELSGEAASISEGEIAAIYDVDVAVTKIIPFRNSHEYVRSVGLTIKAPRLH